MGKFATLKEQFESEVARAEARRAKDKHYYIGDDWWHYTLSDEKVFVIHADRWPRMMVAWDCYQAFKDIAGEGWDNALLKKERELHPEWCRTRDGKPVVDHNEFVDFAKALAGLSWPEAWAMYWKYEWWLIRNGLMGEKPIPLPPDEISIEPPF